MPALSMFLASSFICTVKSAEDIIVHISMLCIKTMKRSFP